MRLSIPWLALVAVLLLVLVLAVTTYRRAHPTLRPADHSRPLVLPRDEAAHGDAAVEWWYYTGHLLADDSSHYGFELVFFQAFLPAQIKLWGPVGMNWLVNPLYFAHFAVTDEGGQAFTYRARMNFPRFWEAGADAARHRLWNGDWFVEGSAGRYTLQAMQDGMAIDLNLASAKPPVLHGDQGIIPMGHAGGSYYYSYTRLEGQGQLTLGGATRPVQAVAWMDHQWGSWQQMGAFQGWDWFAIQLEDKSELMLFYFRNNDGSTQAALGSFIAPDGSTQHLAAGDFQVAAQGHWTSPYTGGTYPLGWRVTVPGKGLDLTVRPTMFDQELKVMPTTYWEGSTLVVGQSGGQPIKGRGYVEMTGYAGH